MAVNLQNISKISQERKNTVFGFIRHNFDKYTPKGIIMICILFYGYDDDELELVELHFELEIDFVHAFESGIKDKIITGCIAEAMNKNKTDVYFDGVDPIEKDNVYYGLFQGYILTSKYEIEKLVGIFYNSLATNVLQKKIQKQSSVSDTPTVEIRELYETDIEIIEDIVEQIEQNDEKEVNNVKLECVTTMSTKIDAISETMNKIYSKVNNIELRMNENQKNNIDTLNKIINEMKLMKQNINKLCVNNMDDNKSNVQQKEFKTWLENKVQLPQYYDLFINNGIDELSVVSLIDRDTLKDLGISIIGHQIKILDNVKQLKQNNCNNDNDADNCMDKIKS
eukprot:77255_1